MEKCDNFFLDKYPCPKTGMLVFEQGHLPRKNLSRTIFASVNYLSSALVKENLLYFHLRYQGKLVTEKCVKENLVVCKVGKFSLSGNTC